MRNRSLVVRFLVGSLLLGAGLVLGVGYGQTSAPYYGYGAGAHIWTTKESSCPSGQYVNAIRVVYRGSCLHQCDLDGGIVGDIQLRCLPVGR